MFEHIIIFYHGYCISKQSVKWTAKPAWEELSHLGPSFLYTDVEMSTQTRASGEYLIASTQGRKDSRRLGLVGSSQSYSIIWKRWPPHQLGMCVCVCVCVCVFLCARQHRRGKIPEGWAWWGHTTVTASFGRGDLPINWECVCVCVCVCVLSC